LGKIKKEYIDKETGIWSLEACKKRHRFDEKLCKRIMELYQPQKVADVGCGEGRYCNYFKEHGWPIVHGYEGTQGVKTLGIYNDIMTMDLTKVRWVDIQYDLVLCLEVGEHIPKKYEQIFFDNIRKFVSKDLILSWAIPGQGGNGHVNEQSNQYVIDELTKRELKYLKFTSIDLRKHHSLKWFKNTIMAFEL